MTALMSLMEQLDCIIVGLATVGIDRNTVTWEWIDTGFVAHIGTDI
jgi:adenine phosphoribosyltransferase